MKCCGFDMMYFPASYNYVCHKCSKSIYDESWKVDANIDFITMWLNNKIDDKELYDCIFEL